MKKFTFLFLSFFLLSISSFAQVGDAGSSNVTHFTYGDLDKLGKLDLTSIYIAELQKLNQLIPYCAFNQKGEATSLAKMGVPGSKDNNANVKKLDASIASHNESLQLALTDIIPYSDKEEIIKAILYVQGIIERVEVGF